MAVKSNRNRENNDHASKKRAKMREFADMVREAVEARIESGSRVEINEVMKNNNVTEIGISITQPGVNVAPNIYLEGYYQMFLKGTTVFEIADQILERSEKACDDLNFDTEAFTDFTKASKRIVFKLVNKKMNEKLLESIPYTDYMDLAMVYYYMLPETWQEKGSGDCGATILIQNSHLKLWKVKKEEVEQVAKENTPKLLPAAIIGMTQMLREMLGEDKFPEELDAESLPMYILSNEKRQNGAAAMAYPETIGNFANACGKNVYIIPSSVHELILVPETGMEKDLNEMVCEVNRTQLDPKDVLSDHVYYYDRQEKQLTGLLRQVTSYC